MDQFAVGTLRVLEPVRLPAILARPGEWVDADIDGVLVASAPRG
ncbi:MAG TPA: hypothetical protein VGL08_21735 [Paraburkholderia sp.]